MATTVPLTLLPNATVKAVVSNLVRFCFTLLAPEMWLIDGVILGLCGRRPSS